GSVSWLYYADRLVEFPLGVFGVAIATVILPKLSSIHANGDARQFSTTLETGVRLGWLIALPCAAGLLLLAAPLITTLFGYGAFTNGDVEMSAWSLRAYALALPGFILVKILAPGFFARQNTRTPVRIGIFAMVSNMAYNIILVGSMLLMSLPAAHTGLALATALSANQQAFMLFRQLRRESVLGISVRTRAVIIRSLVATFGMMFVIWLVCPDIEQWFAMHAWSRVLTLAGIIGLSVAVYVSTLLLSGVRPGDFLPAARHSDNQP
ncbi:MAG: lipid II flippase MurJ, partial [Pseudomonadota bacterium]